ncbi:ribose 5-phosphate isomerase B [Schlesneria paludicola]|uniref:ribose 5-phosphate isomerase B n=1 Tax=Schlesneria paludicola TaxID=360056 RepID=UPI00029A432B|nr:ribose 5-phosphate isomerase B [Schlesneria paludicola]
MRIALGCDHGGFPLKARIAATLQAVGAEIVDCGTDSNCSVDYPDYARKVAAVILAGQAERGILLCGSGVGISVAANKIPGIRAGVCHDTYSAHQGVEHDDMNVLCLGARIVGDELAVELVRAFVAASFTNEERHVRRLNKVLEIEREALEGKFDSTSSTSRDP